MNKRLLYQNKKIFYRATGNGKPVILIHGFGEDGEIWQTQLAYLKNNYKVIVPDLPGSGKSEMIKDMSIEGMAEVVHAIIHEEGHDTCTVIGHSMGGYILLALVEKYWNHVNAMGLFHSTAFADSEEKKANRRKSIEFINQNDANEFLKTAIPNLFAPDSKINCKTEIDKLIEQGLNFSPTSLVSYYNAMINRPDRTAVLKNIAIPVLFIMGKYDTAISLDDCLKLCHLPLKSYIHILDRSGHMGMKEEPEKTNQVLEEFLQSV